MYDIVFAVVFTFIGYRAAISFSNIRIKKILAQSVVEIIDKLIKDGYLKTNGKGPDPEILKWWEKSEND